MYYARRLWGSAAFSPSASLLPVAGRSATLYRTCRPMHAAGDVDAECDASGISYMVGEDKGEIQLTSAESAM